MTAILDPFFYRVRLTKGSAYSALKIWRGFPTDPDTGEVLVERPLIWRAFLNGEHVAIEDVMIEIDGLTGLPAIKGEPCDEVEYLHCLKTYLWAKDHAPAAPEANPRKAIDPLTAPLPW